MIEHMKAMFQVIESIPSEFQIMDRTPVAPTLESLSKGKNIFPMNCAVCHGPTGKEDGPAAVAMRTPPANFQDTMHSGIYGPGEKYWIIGNGSGDTGMAGFAAQLEPLDRWHLVNFIYSLQNKGAADKGHSGHEHKPK